jgi:glucose dehydrogenase
MFVPPKLDSATWIEPRGAGGSNWTPMSYSPRTGWLYVTGQHVPSTYKAGRVDRKPAQFQMGGDLEYLEGYARWGTMVAVDPATGRIRWQKNVEQPHLGDVSNPIYGGGSVATAGDLIFFGDPDGFFNALDARTGERRWRFQTGAYVRATPITYRIGKKQYVVIASNEALLAFALPQ